MEEKKGWGGCRPGAGAPYKEKKKRSPQIAFRVEENEFEEIKKKASMQELNVSEYVRRCVLER